MPRLAIRTVALYLLALVLTACAGAPTTSTAARTPRLDVPYVPTDQHLVDEMLSMASVGRDDVLYDLGSGDGRIVITAARRFGTRGVGYDLDPARVREARDNAQRAGVAHLVRFEQQDIFAAKFDDATVVTMYLLPAVNLRLRPRLLAELRPGTRIVSHNYDLGDWPPLRRKEMEIAGIPHHLFLWVVPAR